MFFHAHAHKGETWFCFREVVVKEVRKMATNVILKTEETVPQGDVDLYAGVDEFGTAANPVSTHTYTFSLRFIL